MLHTMELGNVYRGECFYSYRCRYLVLWLTLSQLRQLSHQLCSPYCSSCGRGIALNYARSRIGSGRGSTISASHQNYTALFSIVDAVLLRAALEFRRVDFVDGEHGRRIPEIPLSGSGAP